MNVGRGRLSGSGISMKSASGSSGGLNGEGRVWGGLALNSGGGNQSPDECCV